MSDIYTKFHWDGDRDRVITERVQDCTAIADLTTKIRNEGVRMEVDGMRQVASIPKVMVEQYCNTHNITLHEWMANDEHVNRMLNDPALAAFRVGL